MKTDRFNRAASIIKSLWKIHLAGIAVGILFFVESIFGWRVIADGRPFSVIERLDFGTGVFSFKRPPGHRIAAVDFKVENDARPAKIYFVNPEGRYLAFNKEANGCLRLFGPLLADKESPRCLPGSKHGYRVTLDDATMRLYNGETLLWEGAATSLTPDVDLLIRSGLRHQAARQFPPYDFKITTRDTLTGKDAVHQLTRRHAAFNTLSAGVLLFLVAVFLPALPLSLLKTRRPMMTAEILCMALLPFWPTLVWMRAVKDQGVWTRPDLRYDPRTKIVEFQGLRARVRAVRPSILFIGGSACAGVPYGRENSLVSVLERRAAEENIPLQAVNFCQVGWDMEDWLRVLPDLLRIMKPDVTVAYLNFNSLILENLRLPKPVFYNLIYFYPYQKLPSRMSFDESHLTEIIKEYDKADALARNNGGRLVVLDDPVTPTYVYSDFYDEVHRRLLDHLAQKGVPVIPLKEDFLANLDDEYFFDACHLSRSGYERCGKTVFDFLLTNGFLTNNLFQSSDSGGAMASWLTTFTAAR